MFAGIACHTDTVHSIKKTFAVYEMDRCLFAMTMDDGNVPSQTGIGGDDRCGIYMCIKALEEKENVKAVFFRFEETGCKGSKEANMDFFSDCSFVLQCDRRGNSDFITNASGIQLASKKFEEDAKEIYEKYGYKSERGLSTDVAQLKINRLNVSAANISCGYWNPHTKYEIISIDDLIACEDLVMELIDKLGGTKYEHEKEVVASQQTFNYSSWMSGAIKIIKTVASHMIIKETGEFMNMDRAISMDHMKCKKCNKKETMLLFLDNPEVFCTNPDCYTTVTDVEEIKKIKIKEAGEEYEYIRISDSWEKK